MDRREFVRSLSALATPIVLPKNIFAIEELSAAILNCAELLVLTDSFDSEDSPRIGVVTVGKAGRAVLSSMYGKLPHLRRSIAIDFNHASEVLAADQKVLLGESDAIRQKDTGALQLLHADKAKAKIHEALTDLDLVFVVTGVDETVCTQITNFVAEVLKEKQTLFVSVPDTVFLFGGTTTFEQFYRGITSPLFEPGLVTVDLESIQDVVSSGHFMALGYGSDSGLCAAESAALAAIAHPLLGVPRLQSASRILVLIEGPPRKSMKIRDVNTILKTVQHAIGDVVHEQLITFGATYNDNLVDEYQVTILAGYS